VSAALLDHLWQSSLVALGAWLLAVLLRGHSAQVRHGIWFCASLKFLLPFSLLASLGAQLVSFGSFAPMSVLAVASQSDITGWMVAPASRAVSATNTNSAWPVVLAIGWSLGAGALLARWCVRWRRIRAVVRSASASGFAAPIPVRISSTLREPGVVGILRPVLVMPAGIESRLTAEQLQAIVAHELCHVRRRDNLTAAVHMLVEAAFWFFPPVWWIGARLLDEREKACDEAVVQSGNDPRTYAEGILKVCRSYWASELPCVAGVSGADLKHRLEAIMKDESVSELGRGRKLLLGMIAVAVIAVPVGAGLASAGDAKATPGTVGRIELLAGKRVRLDYRDVEVRSLLRAMAEAGQVNMLVSDQVKGTVTVNLAETSWDQALAVILHAIGLVKYEKDGILFVEPASRPKAS
jgi:beta-lactamase regulating signal transducer with metallopeptidase domain